MRPVVICLYQLCNLSADLHIGESILDKTIVRDKTMLSRLDYTGSISEFRFVVNCRDIGQQMLAARTRFGQDHKEMGIFMVWN